MEHLRRVSQAFSPDSRSYDLARLHDILEDTSCTYKKLKEDFPEYVEDVKKLTHIKELESYEEYIDRLCEDERLITVKMYDMIDNMMDSPRDKQKAKYRRFFPKILNSVISHRSGKHSTIKQDDES